MMTVACPDGRACERSCWTVCHMSVVEQMVVESCQEQGIPIKVTDPEVIAQVATLMGRS